METVEEVVLDETILDSEPGCSFLHLNTTCSDHVTHAASDCRAQGLICGVATEVVRTKLWQDGVTCKGCGNTIQECWKLWPA